MKFFRFPDLSGAMLLRAADRALFAAYVGAVIAVYILDMIFFGSIADGWFLTGVFILIGAVLRTIAVSSGVFLQTLKTGLDKKDSEKAERFSGDRFMIRMLWVGCVAACLLSAINFFAAGHDAKEHEVALIENVTDETVATKAQRIAREEARILRAEQDRDAAIADNNNQIDMIRNDDVPGISAADNANIEKLNQSSATYREQARLAIDEIEKKITVIQDESDAAKIEKAGVKNQEGTWPVFVWLGEHTPLSSNDWSNTGLFYLAMLIEAVAAFGLQAYAAVRNAFMRLVSSLEIEESVRTIKQDALLNSERIRAEALKAKLAHEANEEADRLWGDLPKPDKSSDPDEPSDKTAWSRKGGKAAQAKRRAQAADDRIPVDDRSEHFASMEANQ